MLDVIGGPPRYRPVGGARTIQWTPPSVLMSMVVGHAYLSQGSIRATDWSAYMVPLAAPLNVLAATETSPDVAAFAGTVPTSTGTMAATEGGYAQSISHEYRKYGSVQAITWTGDGLGGPIGTDSAAFTGTALSTSAGGLGATETAVDTAAFTGIAQAQGTFNGAEARDTAAIVGTAPAQGQLVSTEAPDTATMAGQTLVQGALTATEPLDTAAIGGGNIQLNGTLAAVEGLDTSTLTGSAPAQGQMSATDAVDSGAFTGQALVMGMFAMTEATDMGAIVGKLVAQGVLTATEVTQDTVVMTGSLGPIPIPIEDMWLVIRATRNWSVKTYQEEGGPARTEVGPLEVGEVKPVVFDFGSEVPPEAVLSNPTTNLLVLKGTDSNVSSMLVGSPFVSGSYLVQYVKPGVVGCVYRLHANVQEDSGLKHHMAAKFRVAPA